MPEVRFIKLGGKGDWEEECIIKKDCVRFGHGNPHHAECLAGTWGPVENYFKHELGKTSAKASDIVRQIKDFYTLTEDDIWITFWKGDLYWCRAYAEVRELKAGKSRVRQVIGKWSNLDGNDNRLSVENLDGRVTQVIGYRGTICTVKMAEYLIERIDGKESEDVKQAKNQKEELKATLVKLIEGLWHKDFELLVDLIMTRLGWQRYSVLGKTLKDIDLDLFSPSTQKRALVQIKSTYDVREINRTIVTLSEFEHCDLIYIVYHTLTGNKSEIHKSFKGKEVHVWDSQQLASLVIQTGLIDWLINKRS